MLPVDTYERRATECLQFAESSQSFDDRATWRELALCWLRLSEHAERFRQDALHRMRSMSAGAPTDLDVRGG
jgi:hypothetical protein